MIHTIPKTDQQIDNAIEGGLAVKSASAGLLQSDGIGNISSKAVQTTMTSTDNAVPTSKAVLDGMSQMGGGDMLKAQYDPGNVVYNAGGIPGFVETRLTNMIIGIDDNGVYVKYAI